MSTKQISQSDQKKNIYNRAQRITGYIEKQRNCLSEKNLETFLKYNDDMIVQSISESTRYKNLDHFGLLSKILQKDYKKITKRLQKDYKKITKRLQKDYKKITKRLQKDYKKITKRLQKDYKKITKRLQKDYKKIG